ncbi:hypothetical protein T261_0385 [Streptomyces lydicus]|uniref:DUF6114 domain-containing protein n=1 Tax=Streptomyces chattanoogensis TaxID=66876 RepID=UPI0005D78EFE|nr:DUF6114 domain-containing protein [Streptomyces chattanoogensis]AJT62075.1 hypothetical protein T261_0385 [Streptomyces lydicus]
MIRQRFRRWRHTRPFPAGLCSVAAGVELIAVVGTAPGSLSLSGAGAPASWLLATLMIVAGLTMWLDPPRRYYAGAMTLICGLLSLLLSNLGGYLIGFLLAGLGGSLALAWIRVPTDGP